MTTECQILLSNIWLNIIKKSYLAFIQKREFRIGLRKNSTLHKIKTTKQTFEVIQFIEKELINRKFNNEKPTEIP